MAPTDAAAAVAALKRLGSEKMRSQMGPRFGITGRTAETAFGVPMSGIQRLAKEMRKAATRDGRDTHGVAAELWDWDGEGTYEARMLAVYLADPAKATPALMNRWAKQFDNWAHCDTACFHLFDRVPHALAQVDRWATSREEFVKRTAFALLACLALHNDNSVLPDSDLQSRLPLIETASDDERNFVKKGVNWALRAIGRRSSTLHAEAVVLAERLATSSKPAARWIGKDALRELKSPRVVDSVKKRKAR